MSEMGMLHKSGRRTLRIAPFQQKRDSDADENERPDPTRVDRSQAHSPEQEHDATNRKKRGSDSTVKGAIPKPVGEAADAHSEEARSLRRRMERTPIESYKR